MTTIERLRALLAEGTPGPWGLDSDFGGSLGLVIGPIPEDTDNPDWTTETVAFEIERDADAALIVAAVNALPALLDVAKAARGLTVAHEVLHRRGDPEWEGWECDEQNALRAALDRLDGAK